MPQHLVVRGNNRLPCFFEDRDRHVYLDYAREHSAGLACDIHAFVLMTNHVHIVATGREPGAISRFMQVLNRRYARYVNKAYDRTGTLYEGRFRSVLIVTDRQFFTAMQYVERNPVVAGLVKAPGDYPWSSFRENAKGAPGGLLTAHPLYCQLGATPGDRSRAYLRMFTDAVDPNDLATIRATK